MIYMHFIPLIPLGSCYVYTILSALEINFTLVRQKSKEAVSGLYIRQRFEPNEAWDGL